MKFATHISKNRIRRIVDSLYTSKVRYGLQLLGKVRVSVSDPENGLMSKLQVTQNRMARFLNNSTLSDKISNKDIYTKLNLLSVNQLNGQIKLTEVWKSINNPNYPTKWEIKKVPTDGSRVMRSSNNLTLKESKHSSYTSTSFIHDAAKLWNLTPVSLRECKSIYSAKKLIRAFVLTLPI